MWSRTIPALDVQVGDIIDDCEGRWHLVTHVDRRQGWAWPIAFDGEGWAVALGTEWLAIQRYGVS